MTVTGFSRPTSAENLSAMRTMSIASLESANPETQGSAANRGALPKVAGGDTYCLEHFDEAAVLTEAAAPFRVLAVNQKWLDFCGYNSSSEVCGCNLTLLKGPLSDASSARAIVDDLLARQWSLRTLTNNSHGTDGGGGTRRDLACEVRASAIPEGYLACLRIKPRVSTEEAASGMEAASSLGAVPSLAEVLPVASTRAERQAAMVQALNAWHGNAVIDIGHSSETEISSLSAAEDHSQSAPSMAALSQLGFNQMPQSSAYPQPHAGANALPAWSFGAHAATSDSATANKRSRLDAIRTFYDHTAPGVETSADAKSTMSAEDTGTEPGMPPPRVARYAAEPVIPPEDPRLGPSAEVPVASAPSAPEQRVPSYGQVVSSAEQPMTRAERRAAMAKYFAAQQAV